MEHVKPCDILGERRVVTFPARRTLPHRQYSTREGKVGDEEINAVGLVGFRSWRKTGETRFPFAVEYCPQNEHKTGATKFSFVMESCPQNEHRNRKDKILFLHGGLNTEQKQKKLQMSSQDLTGWYILLQSPLQLSICSIKTLHHSLS